MAGLYTTINEVRGELQTLANDQVVPDSDITRWIRDAGRYIDAELGRVYAIPLTTPLTGPSEILETIARDWVISRALRKFFSDRAFGDHAQWEIFEKSAEDQLAMVLSHNLFAGYNAIPSAILGRNIGVVYSSFSTGVTPMVTRIEAAFDLATGAILTAEEILILEQGLP